MSSKLKRKVAQNMCPYPCTVQGIAQLWLLGVRVECWVFTNATPNCCSCRLQSVHPKTELIHWITAAKTIVFLISHFYTDTVPTDPPFHLLSVQATELLMSLKTSVCYYCFERNLNVCVHVSSCPWSHFFRLDKQALRLTAFRNCICKRMSALTICLR